MAEEHGCQYILRIMNGINPGVHPIALLRQKQNVIIVKGSHFVFIMPGIFGSPKDKPCAQIFLLILK